MFNESTIVAAGTGQAEQGQSPLVRNICLHFCVHSACIVSGWGHTPRTSTAFTTVTDAVVLNYTVFTGRQSKTCLALCKEGWTQS